MAGRRLWTLTLALILCAPSLAGDPVSWTAAELFPLREDEVWHYEVQREFQGVARSFGYRVKCEPDGVWARPDGSETPKRRLVTRPVSGRHRKDILQSELYAFGEDGALLCLERDNGPVRVSFEPPQRVLPAKLEAGASWRWEGRYNGRPGTLEGRCRGPELVELTLNGEETRLRCVAVEVTIGSQRPGGEAAEPLTRELWFAPGVGLVKEVSRDKAEGVETTITGTLVHHGVPEGER